MTTRASRSRASRSIQISNTSSDFKSVNTEKDVAVNSARAELQERHDSENSALCVLVKKMADHLQVVRPNGAAGLVSVPVRVGRMQFLLRSLHLRSLLFRMTSQTRRRSTSAYPNGQSTSPTTPLRSIEMISRRSCPSLA